MAVIHNCSWLKLFGYGYKDKAAGVMECVNFVLNVFMIVPEGRFVRFCNVLVCVFGESSTFVLVSDPRPQNRQTTRMSMGPGRTCSNVGPPFV